MSRRVLNELFRMIANLKHMQLAQLIGYVQSIDWAAIDYSTKLVVVHECNNAITDQRQLAERTRHPVPHDQGNRAHRFPSSRGAPTEAKLGLSNSNHHTQGIQP